MSIYPVLRVVLLPFIKPALKSVTGAENLPPAGGYILAANHVDWLDGFFIASAVDRVRHQTVKFLTTSNNYWWTGVAVQIPDDKSAIVNRASTELKKGAIVCNFPEGQRNSSPTLLSGKTGTVRMAMLANVPVVPVGITACSEKTMLTSIRHLRQPGHAATIRFGAPLTFSAPATGLTPEWLAGETRRLMTAIAPLAGKNV